MKTLLASCAVAALMASPAIAQSTIDPATPDTIPVEPQASDIVDPMLEFQPQTETLPEELPAEPDMAEETPPVMPDAAPVMEAEADSLQEDESYAETGADPVVTVEMADADVSLEATVAEAELPEGYSTDDLNAVMLARVNEVSNRIATLDAEADVWVTADGAPVDPSYAPEGQGDIDVMGEEDAYGLETATSMETGIWDAEPSMTPESDMDIPEDGMDIDGSLTNENPASSDD